MYNLSSSCQTPEVICGRLRAAPTSEVILTYYMSLQICVGLKGRVDRPLNQLSKETIPAGDFKVRLQICLCPYTPTKQSSRTFLQIAAVTDVHSADLSLPWPAGS